MADTLGVNRSTARGIVARYIRERRIRERPRGGRNNVLVDDEMRQCLEDIINENYALTLSQINGELSRRLPAKPLIHDRTVARNLEGMLFRVKLVRSVPADRNRRDVLQRRQEYGNWFMNHAIMRHCVFIDECGYNIWTARNHGRARQGERAYRQVCGQRGRNVTVALAVSPVNGLVSHSTYIGGMNAPRFNDFLAQTRQHLDRRGGYLHLRRCASTSKSRHPRGQYRDGDASGLQPIPEHSGAGNQLTEGSDKRRRIEARNTGSNGRQSGGQTPRYPVRRGANSIATRCSSALHRCYNCC